MAETHEKLLDFERKQHQKMNFQDWTKSELIELIEAEGLEVPGEMLWDNEAGEMRKEVSMRARRRRSRVAQRRARKRPPPRALRVLSPPRVLFVPAVRAPTSSARDAPQSH